MGPVKITIKGPSGTGKSTLAQTITALLSKLGFDVSLTDTEEAPLSREVLEQRINGLLSMGQKIEVRTIQVARSTISKAG